MLRVNDGSRNAPRLEVQQSWWAMTKIGEQGEEWSLEKKFEKLAEAGFQGINGALPAPEEAERWRRLLDEYKFSFSIGAFPRAVSDLTELIPRAREFGVQHINLQVMDSFVVGEEAVALLAGLAEEGRKAGMPVFIETHRGRVTQDLIRTARYVRAIPDLRLTIDLSHYVVAGEVREITPPLEALFDELLRRTSCIHARVSNGEQVQVDVGPNGEHPMFGHFKRWWLKGMGYWLRETQPGDVFPFVTELGPPDYAITRSRDSFGQREEISDRWQQALLLKNTAEELWAELHAGA